MWTRSSGTWFRLVLAFVAVAAGFGELVGLGQAGQEPGDVWQLVAARPDGVPARAVLVGQFALVRLNRPALDGRLSLAPPDRDLRTATPAILSLPAADGSFGRFRVADSPILAPELAAAFPEFRTYTGQGIDDPTATTRFGWTELGFHAIVVSASGTTYVDPYATGNLELYAVTNKGSVQRPALPFICEIPGTSAQRPNNEFPIAHGASLRSYRLALAATGEYTLAAGGTKPAALSRMVASINRVNAIYERELAVRFQLATGPPGDPTGLIFTNAMGDPYTNDDEGDMLAENQTTIDAVIGSANYDFGHVFGTGGGGIASLGSVCSGNFKAQGATGSPSPVGDGFDVDYVAHEIGHQFGGDHTFNAVSAGSCADSTRSAAHASEVGSGSTIQAYAGICSSQNLQLNSDDYFTLESLDQMTAFITSGGGAACGAATVTGNTVPSVTAGGSYTIPVRTPFALTAAGSDANGDTLTYNWEQMSVSGTSTNSVVAASTDSGSNPIVRSYLATTSPTRTFPKLTYVLNNGNVPPQTYSCSGSSCLTGEILPTTNRTIAFHVTARDNRAGGGAIATASTLVTSTTTAGPFLVTSPNTSITVPGGTMTTVTWNVANTAAAPVSAANVRILLSTDGGASFPTVLSASTPNDGSEAVTMANVQTTQARIRVEPVGNIFFDVSNANFAITLSSTFSFTDDPLSSSVTPIRVVHLTELRNAVNTQRSRFGLPAAVWTDPALVAGVTPARAVHILELRTALNAAYAAAGRSAPSYSRTLTAGTTVIAAIDVAELRTAINAL